MATQTFYGQILKTGPLRKSFLAAFPRKAGMRALASKIKSGADVAAGWKHKDVCPANKIEEMENPYRETIRNNAKGARPGTGCSVPPSALGLRENAQECSQGERGRRCLQGTWRAA